MQIIILTYNRPESLKRLLDSLQSAIGEHKADLQFSIEFGADSKTIELAESYNWVHGKKSIHKNSSKLGVDVHFLECISRAQEYDFTLILEDDMYVVEGALEYLNHCKSLMTENPAIAGAGLHHYQTMQSTSLPFTPLKNGSSEYLLQKACSRGFFLSRANANSFYDWKIQDKSSPPVPDYIKRWGDAIWETKFTKYLIDQKKYICYPHLSYLTVFGEKGAHYGKLEQRYMAQADLPFQVHAIKNGSELIKYDAWYEIDPKFLQKHQQALSSFDFATDLYGTKNKEDISEEYVLRPKTKFDRETFASFGMELKPRENNILRNISGEDIVLIKRENMKSPSRLGRWKQDYHDQLYMGMKHSLILGLRNTIVKYFGRFF